MEEELDLFELLDILKNRWRLIVGLVIVAVAVAGVVSFFVLEPVYEADATVILKPATQRSQPMVLSDTAVAPYANLTAIDPVLAVSINNVVEVFKSRAVLGQVIDKVGLDIKIPSLEFNSFAQSITIQPQKSTSGISIKVQSNSSTVARDITNALVTEGVSVVRAIKAEEIQSAQDFVENQLKIVGARLNEIETSLGQKSNDSAELNRQLRLNEELYILLSQKLLELQVVSANQLEPVEFIQEAVEPVSPVKPKKALNIAIAAFLAGFVGVFWVFFQHALESRKTSIAA